MSEQKKVYNFNSKPSFNFGQYQKQVSLLSGISLSQIYDALEPTGMDLEVKKEELEVDGDDDLFNLRLDCSMDALRFSVTILSETGDNITSEDEMGIAIQFNAFFSDEDLTMNKYELLNLWNSEDTFSKAFFSHGVIVLEMVLPAAGVVDENVNEGIYAWVDIVEDFHVFLGKNSD